MNTAKRVKEVACSLTTLVVAAAICWCLPLTVMASPSTAGTLSEPENMASAYHRQSRNVTPSFNADDVTQGMMLYQMPNGDPMPALPLDTDVSMQISGLTNRVSVKQTFRNQTTNVLSGQYLFPLPTGAKVDALKLQIGQRAVEGKIQSKQQPNSLAPASDESSMLDINTQSHGNMFTTEITRLAPEEQLIVEISYQETLHYDEGVFSLRFPLVVAPRYIPGLMAQGLGQEDEPEAFSQQIRDLERIVAPLHDWNFEQEVPLLADINVSFAEGIDTDSIVSLYHSVTLEQGMDAVSVSLAEPVVANRDFVLQWRQQQGKTARAWVFNQDGKTHFTAGGSGVPVANDDAYSLLMLMPPKSIADEKAILSRELILVIDTSGSMAGEPIVQAKNALRYALRSLNEEDRFNIIAFNSKVSSLANSPLRVTKANLDKAQQFVNRLTADGGTEMASALEMALTAKVAKNKRGDRSALRQVIFMTDGSVGNEEALYDLIHQHLGESRLYTVGIGAAPNSHFMQRIAQIGRGTFTSIGHIEEVEQQVTELLTKIQYPVLTDIKARFDDGSIPDFWPSPIPDLYRAEPVLISLKRHGKDPRAVVISGRQGHKHWQQSLSLLSNNGDGNSSLGSAHSGRGLDLIWARNQIAAMELTKNGSNDAQIEAQITALAMNYHLVSDYTRLVAIDESPASSSGISRDSVVRQHMPLGWLPFGHFLQMATSSRLDFLLGLFTLLPALFVGWRMLRHRRQERSITQAFERQAFENQRVETC
ncbi:marine proteobacterial sortase target protein [Shewanella acanthi]|uniref:marine proteobacterial sortase target protein n=1 Tax=Shewanella acanthi TaxID=2864212 RepID=UPI001C660458|nr:marine proteobacterial sortase target protein [Shewanella acanthi]QYJ77502.1 marine proteobacterial sortase target protein [Shewanella acanthi]